MTGPLPGKRESLADITASVDESVLSETLHTVQADADGLVTGMGAMNDVDIRINGGFFVLRRKVFDYINEGEELVDEPFARLIEERRLVAWQVCVDAVAEVSATRSLLNVFDQSH